jgi:hypothetical protein
MAKSWTVLRALIVLAVMAFGVIWALSLLKNEEATPLYPATINRDCAPWDGTAFTVSIPWKDAATLDISIYQSPELMRPVTFSFPDETMRVGSAYLLLPVGVPEQLNGKVYFERVETGKIVEGRFDLVSESGEKLRGTFRAEWRNQVIFCG